MSRRTTALPTEGILISLPPILNKRRQSAGLIVQTRTPDGDKAPEMPEADSAMEMAAQDIMDAIKGNDPKRLAQAIKAAFEICDSEPHVEGPHTNEG